MGNLDSAVYILCLWLITSKAYAFFLHKIILKTPLAHFHILLFPFCEMSFQVFRYEHDDPSTQISVDGTASYSHTVDLLDSSFK